VTKVSDIFRGESLKASDLKGKDVSVTIKSWDIKEFSASEKKIELYFTETDRSLILNKINANSIAKELQTEDLDKWSGATVVLCPDKTDFQGERVDCIRIRRAFFPETEADAPF